MSYPFDIVDIDGFYAIKNQHSVVAVIVYSLDEQGVLEKIGVVEEKNPHFQDGKYKGPVMGGVEIEDKSLLHRAKLETLQEAGYDVQEPERWSFIGELHNSKIFPEPIYCYSVDVTGIKGETPKGDGSEQEAEISFEMIPLSEAFQINDAVLQTCFFKLVMKLNKQEISNYGTTK